MDPEYIRSILQYDPNTGALFWNRRIDVGKAWNTRFSGKEAFTYQDSHGYMVGRINGKKKYAHRIAWVITYGENPKYDIDHINMDRSDNRISNLRLATESQNLSNRVAPSSNTSGYKGVSWCKERGLWEAYITSNGKRINLGRYGDIHEASTAYDEASALLHGEFSVTNETIVNLKKLKSRQERGVLGGSGDNR